MSPRVLVAMSGGVDSSVAAARLVEQGYDVVGATMKLFCYGDNVPDRPCCSLDSINDARDVAHAIGIPHYVLNLEDRFNLHVIQNFVSEYSRGRTPIPCVRCNSFTKFRDLLAHADALECDYIATGHYAIARDGALYRGRDPEKDQSYFLWGIDQPVVARMLTPVGELSKPETVESALHCRDRSLRKLMTGEATEPLCHRLLRPTPALANRFDVVRHDRVDVERIGWAGPRLRFRLHSLARSNHHRSIARCCA